MPAYGTQPLTKLHEIVIEIGKKAYRLYKDMPVAYL